MDGDEDIVNDNSPFISTDPMFVDKENGNYRIGDQSELYGTGIGYQYP